MDVLQQFSDGVYCCACVVFAQYHVGGYDLGQFVLEQFQVLEDYRQSNRACEECVSLAMMGVQYESPSQAVDAVLNRPSNSCNAKMTISSG